ncbi:bifunctional riboflavin kinase/FAD synthetase [Lacinutrix sp. MEBiC02404]
MKIIESFQNLNSHKTIVTIGTFDGVHIGHRKIIERLVNTAKQEHLKSVVLTFFPHPRMVLQKDANIKLINTIEERSQILNQLGIDYLCIKKFTKEFSRLSAEEFVADILVKQLNIKKIIIGYDHHFGRNRSANIEDLKRFGKAYNFEVEEISAQDINDVSVSSTKIRTALTEGDIETANSFLGTNFMFNGKVTKGKGLGKTINFPTANIAIDEAYKLIPKQGVYVVRSTYKNQKLFGMMNIGTNPTISDNTKQTIEVHFFKFNENIYDENITVEILTRIRDEQKFESLEALKKQIEQDKIIALQYITQSNIE